MEETISFEDLGLDESTLAAVERKGFETPSPIQILAIPRLLEGDANVIAKARTGTGKTAAFGLPLVQTIRQKEAYVQALVLTPTRELALQVCKEIDSFTTDHFPRLAAVYGGQSMGEQIRTLKKGVEIVVGTPGRVQDHLERGTLDLSKIKYFILDEADEMLDMGFIDDIEHIFSTANPDSRILLFSATMPLPILKIAARFMGEYEIVEEAAPAEAPVLTEQKYLVIRENDKLEALVRIIDISPDFYGLVFTQTKVDADMLTRRLDERGYEVAALHGDISQQQREKILYRFRSRKTRILVATDVAARGIDIEGLTHVINYSLPFDSSTYIHRIGRTGRAGAYGEAITFVRPDERRKLEHLKSAVRKNVKGSLTEMQVPTVEKVLSVKRDRLFDTMKTSLLHSVPDLSDVSDGTYPADTGVGNGLQPVCPDGISTASGEENIFARMAAELCGDRPAETVLASVLEVVYGRQLDASRYGEITPVERNLGDGQIRLYVQLGRRDGYYPRELAAFFSRLLRIPPRQVDRIDTADTFSLVSLPATAAKEALEKSKRDKSLPHMHIDVKADGSGENRRGGRFRGERNRFSGHRNESNRRLFDSVEERNKHGRDSSRRRFAGDTESFRKAVSGGASAYKRKLPR